MNRLWRTVASLAAAALGWSGLVACPRQIAQPVYGAPLVKYGPPPIMFELEVKSFNCTPASPVRVGDTLVFTAELEPADNLRVEIYGSMAAQALQLRLHDDGQVPDAAAGDNVFSGSAVWQAEYGSGSARISLDASGDQQGQPASGSAELPLEVLP